MDRPPLPDLESLRVVVVGDALVDRYVHARPERLSREAPVPVFVEEREELRPGGAANVAANLAALGCSVELLAPVGDDPAGTALRELLERAGVRVRTSRAWRGVRLPVKTRVLAAEPHRTPQQVLRLDRAPSYSGDGADPTAAWRVLARELVEVEADAVLYSEYGYGDLAACRTADEALRARGVLRVLDPRRLPGPFAGLDAATPNLDDFVRSDPGAVDASDLDGLARAAATRRTELGVRNLLVTLGNRGMLLCGQAGASTVPAAGREGVVDVSGAGDTAAAVFTAALALGWDPARAMELANAAAGEVVMESGTAVVDRERLARVWREAPGARPLARPRSDARPAEGVR